MNRFQETNSASLCSLAGRYDNPIAPRFLAPIGCLKIPAHFTPHFLKLKKGAYIAPAKCLLRSLLARSNAAGTERPLSSRCRVLQLILNRRLKGQ
jgi:hypothetical protein